MERIVGYLWRLCSCGRIEAGLLGGGAQVWNQDLVDLLRVEGRKQKQPSSLTDDISIRFSVVVSEADLLSKLARYETGLDRAFYRCLHELQRLQALRMNLPASAPPTLDLSVTIENS